MQEEPNNWLLGGKSPYRFLQNLPGIYIMAVCCNNSLVKVNVIFKGSTLALFVQLPWLL